MASYKLKTQRPFLIVAFLCLIVSAVLISCNKGDNPIGDIKINGPSEALPGKPVQLTLVINPPMSDPSTLRFKWSAERGSFHPSTDDAIPSCQYIAPETPGTYAVTAKILRGEEYLAAKTILITVKGQGVQTATASPEFSITPAPDPSASATDSPFFAEINKLFFPSGWMGDGKAGRKYVQVDSVWRDNPHSAPTCYKWTYHPGDEGFAAVAWQYPENNWGKQPGRNLQGQGFTKVTFWVRGERGGEQLTFKAGGHTDASFPYQASFEEQTSLTLTRNWQRGEIKLPANLSNAACGFAWVTTKEDNPNGVVFFLDDMRYEK